MDKYLKDVIDGAVRDGHAYRLCSECGHELRRHDLDGNCHDCDCDKFAEDEINLIKQAEAEYAKSGE